MSDVLRLAVDARDLASDTRGIGRYARAILPRIARRDDIELTLLVYAPLFRARRSQLRDALGGADGFRLATRAFGCDVMWHPGNGSFFLPSAANVVTIHDAGPFRFPQDNPRKRRHQQEPFYRSARQAQRVIAVSNFGRAEVLEILGVAPERIDVVYHGVDDIFTEGDPRPAQAMVERPYFIFVGDPIAEPRKNFSTLFEAYNAAFPDDESRPLLVVLRPVRPALPGVRYVGPSAGSGPDDVHLRDLYRGALALCMPSYYEGFGMPLLEAMACGTPVISSDVSSLPEIGGSAALYASPYDVRAWSDVLQRIAADDALRMRLRAEGLEHVKAFSWERSAERHAEIFHSL